MIHLLLYHLVLFSFFWFPFPLSVTCLFWSFFTHSAPQGGAWVYLPPPSAAPYNAANVEAQKKQPQLMTSFQQPSSSKAGLTSVAHRPVRKARTAVGKLHNLIELTFALLAAQSHAPVCLLAISLTRSSAHLVNCSLICPTVQLHMYLPPCLSIQPLAQQHHCCLPVVHSLGMFCM